MGKTKDELLEQHQYPLHGNLQNHTNLHLQGLINQKVIRHLQCTKLSPLISERKEVQRNVNYCPNLFLHVHINIFAICSRVMIKSLIKLLLESHIFICFCIIFSLRFNFLGWLTLKIHFFTWYQSQTYPPNSLFLMLAPLILYCSRSRCSVRGFRQLSPHDPHFWGLS